MARSQKQKRTIPFVSSFFKALTENKIAFTVYGILQILTVITIIRCAIAGAQNHVMTGLLALAMGLIPVLVKLIFRVKLSTVLETLAYLFIFSAEVLGEINAFYGRFPFWDGMLHVICGFMFAAFGYCLVDVFHKSGQAHATYSPLFLSLMAFCFSMTVGVFWEFIEYTGDYLMQTDMQKDMLLDHVNSFIVPHSGGGNIARINDIVKMDLYTADGQIYTTAGYLDVGLADTIKDMFVNFIGAIAFCMIGYFNLRHPGTGRIAKHFIPVLADSQANDTAARNEESPTSEKPDCNTDQNVL